MKLATLADGSRDGRLAIVSRDLGRALPVTDIARTFQDALDRWHSVAAHLRDAARKLESGGAAGELATASLRFMAPLPRAYQWVDGSAFVNHVELVRKARGATMPESYWTDPLVYQGGSDDFLGPADDAPFGSEDWGIDLEAEVAVIVGDVPMGSTAAEVRERGDIRFLMLVNDWSLRNLIPPELAKGFGFYQSKPATAFSPVAVTPDELGPAWDGARLHLPLVAHVNGSRLGSPDAGEDMTFGFPELVAHCAKTRNLRAGTVIGSGTVSNYERSRGSACIAEVRALESVAAGSPRTPYLGFGDRVRIEMFDATGASIFGAIDQRVCAA